MPRTVEEILVHADELAKRFEDFEPEPGSVKDARSLRDTRQAFEDAARAQERLAGAISIARAAGHSWSAIGAVVGTTGEAARQRYGKTAAPIPPPQAAAPPRDASVLTKKTNKSTAARVTANPRSGLSQHARSASRTSA